MIHHLRGTLLEKTPDRAIIETCGIGFEVLVPSTSSAALPPAGEECRLYTRLLVRETGPMLCGFATRAELIAFDLLSSVGGVGPALALGAVSALGPHGLFDALERADSRPLMRVKRVGKRLAERIVVELKGRAGELAAVLGPAVAGKAGLYSQAEAALVGLGFSPPDAAEQVRRAAESLGDDASLEEMVQKALRLDSPGGRG